MTEYRKLGAMGLIDAFFWHWVETPEPFGNFRAYLDNYERDLRGVMDECARALREKRILPVTHIGELLLFILTGRKRGTSACGVELKQNYDILGGRIHACADLPQELAIGTIGEDGAPRLNECELGDLLRYKEDLGCGQCGVEGYCGGRCPVQAVISSAERILQYCQLMRLHVATVMEYAGECRALLAQAGFGLQDLYDSSVIYNQFTDVTP